VQKRLAWRQREWQHACCGGGRGGGRGGSAAAALGMLLAPPAAPLNALLSSNSNDFVA